MDRKHAIYVVLMHANKNNAYFYIMNSSTIEENDVQSDIESTNSQSHKTENYILTRGQ